MILKFLANPMTLVKLAVVSGVAALTMQGAAAQEMKIGYINSQRIVSEAAPYKAASDKIKVDFAKRAQDLQDMDSRFKALQAKLEKDAPVMSDADRTRGQHDLVDMSKELQRKQREFQEDLTQRQNEEREAIFVRVNKVITQIATAEKYDLIVQDALYHSTRVDITDKVLSALNK
jgi:outer membrane protein